MSNQPTSLFSEILKQQTIKPKDSESEFEEQMNKRGDGLFQNTQEIGEIKQESQTFELSRNQMERERTIENRRRLRNNIKVDFGKSYKDCLTIDLNSFDQAQKIEANPKDLDIYVKSLASENQLEQFFGLVGIRKLLTLPQDPLIQEIIDRSIVFALVNTLEHKLPEFVYEAVCCICAITTGNSDQTKSVTSKGAHKKLIILCDSPFIEIQEQAIWGLGNLASDNPLLRDSLINEGALNKLLYYLKSAERKSLVKNVIWAYSNFFKPKGAPKYEVVSPVLDYILQSLIKFKDDNELVNDCVNILSFFSDNFMKKTVQYLSTLNVLPIIVQIMMQSESATLIMPCLRILGGFVSKCAMTTQQVVDSGALDVFPKLLTHPDNFIRKEICWMISNIAAGTLLQLETLVSKGYLKIMTNILNVEEQSIRSEAIWAICNFTLVEKRDLIESIFKDNIVATVCNILKFQQAKYIAVALEALSNLLKFGKNLFPNQDGSNPVALKLEELKMFDYIESLQYHESEVVYEKAFGLIEAYLEVETS